jgi:hypothetical protein
MQTQEIIIQEMLAALGSRRQEYTLGMLCDPAQIKLGRQCSDRGPDWEYKHLIVLLVGL